MIDMVNNRTAIRIILPSNQPRLYRPRRNAVYMTEQDARELLRRINGTAPSDRAQRDCTAPSDRAQRDCTAPSDDTGIVYEENYDVETKEEE